MPTKALPSSPSLDHLKSQARDLIKYQRAHDPEAIQRIREFHPRFQTSSNEEIGAAKFSLTDAQLSIAREYGFATWARIKSHIEKSNREDLELPIIDRIQDPSFRRAVEMIDSGDVTSLQKLFIGNQGLVQQRVLLEGSNYFRNPSLLEFCAENPVRNDKLPANIVQIANVILDAGAKLDRLAINSTLELVSSGRVSRESGVQLPIIDLLCDHGADPSLAIRAALVHGEFQSVEHLIRRGAKLDLPAAAALGRTEDAKHLIHSATGQDRHLALTYAAQFGHVPILRLLIEAGEDPNRYNPPGAHSHSTPLHQAAWGGHLGAVRLLVERGAKTDVKDILFHGTPLGWAEHGGKTDVAEYLRNVG